MRKILALVVLAAAGTERGQSQQDAFGFSYDISECRRNGEEVTCRIAISCLRRGGSKNYHGLPAAQIELQEANRAQVIIPDRTWLEQHEKRLTPPIRIG